MAMPTPARPESALIASHENRIILGDCLDVLRGLPDASVDAIVTDPPYGMDYQSARRSDKSKRKRKIANDIYPFIWWLYDAYRITQTGGALACFCDWRGQDIFRTAIECAGFTVRSQVIWDREWHGLGDLKATFAPQHDIIWFATKGRYVFPSGRPKSVLRAQRVSALRLVHPNEKPLTLMSQLIHAITPTGGIVLDPFAGSGSTLVAAKAGGWRYLGIEREAEYVAIAEARLAATAEPSLGSAVLLERLKPVKQPRQRKPKQPAAPLWEMRA